MRPGTPPGTRNSAGGEARSYDTYALFHVAEAAGRTRHAAAAQLITRCDEPLRRLVSLFGRDIALIPSLVAQLANCVAVSARPVALIPRAVSLVPGEVSPTREVIPLAAGPISHFRRGLRVLPAFGIHPCDVA